MVEHKRIAIPIQMHSGPITASPTILRSCLFTYNSLAYFAEVKSRVDAAIISNMIEYSNTLSSEKKSTERELECMYLLCNRMNILLVRVPADLRPYIARLF